MKKFTSEEIKEFVSKSLFDEKIILKKDPSWSKINWSGIRNNSVFGKLLRLLLRMIPHSMVMKIRYGPCRGMKWIEGSSNHGCCRRRVIEKLLLGDITN